MNSLVADILLAFALTYFIMPIVIRVAQVKKLYDTFDERKAHTNPTPRLGGIAIFIGLILSLLLTAHYPDFQYYIASLFIIFILGVIDDILVLAAWKKVIVQLLIAGLLVSKAGLAITNLHGFIGVYEMDAVSSNLFTVFTIFVVINAFNLIDGIDGLAGSLGTLSCLVMAVFYYINGDMAYAALGFCMAGTLLAFLAYNFPPAKIFMGDCGSLTIGLVNAILVIHFIETGDTSKVFHVNATPAIGFGLILIPVMDCLRVFILRVSKGQSPFVPDRNHLHHLLLNKGFSHKTITLVIAAISITLTSCGFIAQVSLGTTTIVALLSLLFFVSVYIMKHHMHKRVVLHVVDDIEARPVEQADTKIVPIYNKKTEAISFNEE